MQPEERLSTTNPVRWRPWEGDPGALLIIPVFLLTTSLLISFGEWDLEAFVFLCAGVLSTLVVTRLDNVGRRGALVATFLTVALVFEGRFWAIRLHQDWLFPAIFLQAAGLVVWFWPTLRQWRYLGLVLTSAISLASNLVLVVMTWGNSPIDVFTIQQMAARALLDGRNPYSVTMMTNYVVAGNVRVITPFHFPYGPSAILLDLPGVALGDVRISYLIAAGLLMWAIIKIAGNDRNRMLGPAVITGSPLLLGMVFYAYVDLPATAMFVCWLWIRDRHRVIGIATLAMALCSRVTIWPLLIPFFFNSRQQRNEILLGVAGVIVIATPFMLATGPLALLTDVANGSAAVAGRPDSLNLNGFLLNIAGLHMPNWLTVLLIATSMVPVLISTRVSMSRQAILAGWCGLAFVFLAPYAYFNYYFPGITMLIVAAAGLEVSGSENPSPLQVHQRNA